MLKEATISISINSSVELSKIHSSLWVSLMWYLTPGTSVLKILKRQSGVIWYPTVSEKNLQSQDN